MAPIFSANYSTARSSADCQYSLPQGLHVYPDGSCKVSFSSKQFRTEKDFAQSLFTSVQPGSGAFGVEFSASDGYRTTSSKIHPGETFLIISDASCHYYKSRLDLHAPPPLNDDFVQLVNRLITAGDQQAAAHDFFNTYGTHFALEMDFGARFTKQHQMTYHDYDEAVTLSDLDITWQANFASTLDLSGETQLLNDEQRQAAANFQKRVETTTHTVGTTPPVSGDATTWASMVKQDPMPIRYKLRRIDSLFTAEFMSSISGYARAGHILRQHKDSYCAKLPKHLGVRKFCARKYSGW